jgi:hypothetical protein
MVVDVCIVVEVGGVILRDAMQRRPYLCVPKT